MTEYATVVLFMKALVAPVGLGITFLAYRAYQQSRDPSLQWFAAGFGTITAGMLLGGGFDRILGIDIGLGLLIHSFLTTVGFLILARSVYMRDTRRERDDSTLTSGNR